MTASVGGLAPYISRHAENRLAQALTQARIVALVGPRQAGKTTLARRLAVGYNGRRFVSLDDQDERRLAAADVDAFVAKYQFAVIDEIQRVPDLILALKRSVDENPQPGRYLITGSVDLFKSALSPDSLAGRMAIVPLLPFSQAEKGKLSVPGFLHRAFAADFDLPADHGAGDQGSLADRIVAGGYPGALVAASATSRQAWLGDYVRLLVDRDLSELFGPPRNAAALGRLLNHCAASAGGLVNLSALAGRLGVAHNTVDRWLAMLEQMFVIRRIDAWHGNRIRRLIKAPKLHFVDSGVLAWLMRANADAVRARRTDMGCLLESFVYSEIAKAIGHFGDHLHLCHYRDKNGNEVDFVVEDFAGNVVGLEVKSSASVSAADFRGLRCLADLVGESFACGIILHDGARIRQFGTRLFAMPVAMLWQG